MPETYTPGLLRRVWAFVYEHSYRLLRAVVFLIFRPLFLIRRVGPAPQSPSGGLIVCANHASYLDPAFVQLLLPQRIVFVMTHDFYRRAWGRWFFRLVGAIPVASGRMAKTGMGQALALLRRGQAIGIFPEGRLTRDGTPGPPQRGVAFLARMGRAPILPVGIFGNYRAWPRGALRFRRADVRVAFGPLLAPPPPHPASGRAEEQAFASRIMAAIKEARQRARLHGRSLSP